LRRRGNVKIEDYQRLALDNGLVVMVIDTPMSPYKIGSCAGFKPEEAMFYHQEGLAHPINGPVQFEPEPPEPPAASPALVPIPKDWRTLNRLQKAKIVSEIHGTALTTAITTKECDDAITAELVRRDASGAGVPAGAPSVTAAGFPSAA
jgi:hypothetical protein